MVATDPSRRERYEIMLSSIRNMLGSFLVLALMGLLIASFALWGIPDIFTTSSGRTVAEVDDAQISDIEFARRYEQRLREIQAQFGEAFSRDQARQLGVPQQTLQQMVSQLVFDLHAREIGLRASPSQVIEQLQEIPAFEGLTGGFDRATYEQQLQNLGMSPGEFEDQLRRDIIRAQLFRSLTVGVPVPDALARALFRYRQEERKATILTAGMELVADVTAPTEEEMRQAYELQKDQYMTPTYRDIAVARINPEDIAKPQEVTRAELEEAYQARLNEYQIPELRNLRIVTFPRDAREEAEAFVERVSGGGNFDDTVTEMTDFTPEETRLGDLSYSDLDSDYNAQVAEAVFATEEGALTEPVQSVFGWHVFKVEDVTPPENRLLAEVEETLRQEVAREKALDAVYDISVEAEEALASGASVEEIARNLSLAYARATVTRDGLKQSGELADDIVVEALESALSLPVEEPPTLEPTEENGFMLIDVLGTVPPEQKPFEAVVEEIRDQLVRERRMAAAGELAETAADRLRAGEAPETVAEDMGLALTRTDWVPRNARGSTRELAPSIARLVFQMEKGEVGIERAATQQGYIAARVDEIRPGDSERNPGAFADLTAQLEQRLLNDALTQYERALRESMGVEVNQQRFSEIVSPEQATF